MHTEILLVTEAGYPWAVGGVSTWIDDLVRGLPGREFTVLGLRFDGAEQPPATPLPPGVHFIDLACAPPVAVETVVARAVATTAGCEPAIVHASSSGIAGLVGLALSRETGAPLAVTEHGIAWLDAPPGDGDGVHTPGLLGRHDIHASVHWLYDGACATARAVYAGAAAITSVSHANATVQRRLVPGTRPIQVIPNGVRLPEEPAAPATGAPGLVVFAGRIAPEKGADRFIRVAALLAQRHRGLRFELRGPVEDPGYLEQCRMIAAAAGLDEERLRFAGAVPRDGLFSGASLLLLPSRIEACAYVLIEALAAGVPAVVSAAGDNGRIAGEAGLAVTGDDHAFARAAEVLLEPAAAGTAAARGRARIAAGYSSDAMLSNYQRLYARLDAGSRRRRRAA